ncbi:Cortactin-binding protein 2 [Chlorella vulgaris]
MAALQADGEGTPGVTLLDLPNEVLALMVALGLTHPRDVASFAAASTRCKVVCAAAPLRMAVTTRSSSPSEEQAEARRNVSALCVSWPGTAELDLTGSPLENSDVLAALAALPALERLQLDRCKKITPALCCALQQRSKQHPQLHVVTLQRCFQLSSAALTHVLAARLSCAALSHLSLDKWPAGEAALPRSQLRMLALHNCGKLGSAALQGIAIACPELEVLMLGGGSFLLEEELPACDEAGGIAADTTASTASTQLPSADGERLHQTALAAVLQGSPALGAAFSTYVAGVATQLALMARKLPQLRVLELTFGLPQLVPALQHLALNEPLLLEGRSHPLQVWDLCSASSLAQAQEWRRQVQRRQWAAGGSACARQATITPADVDAFLCAAVNCSSAARQTALHSAAEEASPAQLQQLVSLGALVDARDRSGATPLFAACEAGHLASVECLLGAGASVTLKNSAGEAPLYIAALKGHEHVVDLLLQHCKDTGISWQAHTDGDAWTPLMAAAVGGRTGIVVKLLEEAGQQASDLVQAANRYGQTTLHIAARKGSATLLSALVDAGGADSLLRADQNGRTAAEIACRMRNVSANFLCHASREAQRQRSTVPPADRPRPNEHRQQHHAPQRPHRLLPLSRLNTMPPAGPSQWTVSDVCAWLEDLELHTLVPEFKSNAVSGQDLITLTDEDLQQELHCTSLQARKIRKALASMGITPAASPAPAPATGPATPAVAPSPAPAAPAPTPASSEPDPLTCFASADLQRYRQLQSNIAGLQGLQIASKVTQAQHFTGQVKQQLDNAQRALQHSRQAYAEADEAHKKLVVDDSWYPGKVLGGKAKKEEKKEHAETALKQATDEVRSGEQRVAALSAQLQEAQKQQAAWQGKDAELSAAQRDLVSLTERMFQSPAWRSAPRMVQVQDAARTLDAQASEAARGVSTYGKGSQLLQNAVAHLQQAMEGLSRTQAMGMVELMSVRRNNFGMDMMEMAIYRRANEACQLAARDAEEARRLLGPGLPAVDSGLLDAAKRGLFANMLFGGGMMDVMQIAMVRKSIEQVKAMMAQLKPAAQWAQSNLAVYQHKDAELKGQAAAKRRELEALRGAALKAALEAGSGGGAVPPIEKLSLI